MRVMRPYWLMIMNLLSIIYKHIQYKLRFTNYKDDFYYQYLNNKQRQNPAKICLFKGSNRITRTRSEICSELTIKTSKWRQRRRSGIFIVNFEHISHHFLVFLLLTLNKQMLAGNLHNVPSNTSRKQSGKHNWWNGWKRKNKFITSMELVNLKIQILNTWKL